MSLHQLVSYVSWGFVEIVVGLYGALVMGLLIYGQHAVAGMRNGVLDGSVGSTWMGVSDVVSPWVVSVSLPFAEIEGFSSIVHSIVEVLGKQADVIEREKLKVRVNREAWVGVGWWRDMGLV